MFLVAEFRLREPRLGKFFAAVGHIFTAENAEFQHLFRGQLRFEIRMKVFPRRLSQKIPVASLHTIIYYDLFGFHCKTPKIKCFFCIITTSRRFFNMEHSLIQMEHSNIRMEHLPFHMEHIDIPVEQFQSRQGNSVWNKSKSKCGRAIPVGI